MESSKWLGQCPGCGAWGSFVEEPVVRTSTGKAVAHKESRQPSKLSEVEFSEDTRIASGIEELDRVLGGGIVVGSLVLVGGDPGIGKSTLLLQMCQKLVQQRKKVLYVSGEESEKQIKMRADRLGVFQSDLLVMSETDLDIVAETITRSTPDVVIIDSIQTMYREEIGSAPGSVGQVRETTSTLLRLAKGMSISIFIVGHVTKEGVVAGPRVLEHMVDTVLYFEGTEERPIVFCAASRTVLGQPMRWAFLRCVVPVLLKWRIHLSLCCRVSRRMHRALSWHVLWREPDRSLWKYRGWYARRISIIRNEQRQGLILTV